MAQEGGKRQLEARETRRRLFAAASALFAQQGYHETTIDQIVRQAGVAKGTFFLHFATKEAVVTELVGHQTRAALRARAEALGAGDEGLLLRWTLRLFAEHDRGGPRQVEGCWLPGPVWELMEAAEDAIGAKLTKSATARHRRRLAAAAVRRALQEELLPWCLGEGDPLRARLAARGGP